MKGLKQYIETGVGRSQAALWKVMHELLGEAASDLRGLLVPWHQSKLVQTQKAFLIVSRVRLVALMFAVLTPLWILIDAQLLPRSLGVSLAFGRIVTAIAFAGLFVLFRKTDSVIHSYLGTFLLFLIPTAFYVYSHSVLYGLQTEQVGLAATLVAGYTYLPFVLVAGLAVFPLSAIEGVVFVTPAMFLMGYMGLSDTPPGYFHDRLGMLWLMGMISGVAILSGMSQLHYLSEIIIKSAHDSLTNAFNRASGLELLDRYFLLAKRNKSPLTLMFFDLDNFKAINDRYGHEAGDVTLQQLVERLTVKLRGEDLIIRWGGEEFLIVLPHTDGISADLRENIFQRIAEAGLGERPDGTPLTASVGVVEMIKDQLKSPSDMIELADTRMYRAKHSGRDRFCFGDNENDMNATGFFSRTTSCC